MSDVSDWVMTADGRQQFTSDIECVVDPTTGNVAVLILGPKGGIGRGISAMAKGDPGTDAVIEEAVALTVLAPDDPTDDFAFFETLSPGVVKLHQSSRKGPKGDDGGTILDPTDYGTPIAGQVLTVAPGATTFELDYQKFMGRHYPASIDHATSGNTNKTLAVVSIAANTYPTDFRVEVQAQTIITTTGLDCRVDLVAHLGSTGGNDIGRCFGVGGSKDRLMIAGGAAFDDITDAWDKQAHGSACNIYIVTEKQSGADNYTTSADTTRIKVNVYAV